MDKPYIKVDSGTWKCCGTEFSRFGVIAHYKYKHLSTFKYPQIKCDKCDTLITANNFNRHKCEYARKRQRPPGVRWNKGQPAWNRGLTEQTDLRVAKNAASLRQGYSSGRLQPVRNSPSTEAKVNLRNHAIRRNLGGYKQGIGRGTKGRYQGIWCDSSFELAWVIFHLEHETQFSRNTDKFQYTFEGVERTYIPDFKVGEFWVEIKGWLSDKDRAKFRDFPHPDKLIILDEKDLSSIFEYVKGKYGKKFWHLYN